MDRVQQMDAEYQRMMEEGEARDERVREEIDWIIQSRDWEAIATQLAKPANFELLSDMVFIIWEATAPDRPYLHPAYNIIKRMADAAAEERVG